MCNDPTLVPRSALFDVPPTGPSGAGDRECRGDACGQYLTCTADPPPTQYVYYQSGNVQSTTKVVFVHGSPSRAHVWRHFVPIICEGASAVGDVHCIFADNVGFGDSGKPPIRYGVIDMCQYTTAFLDVVLDGAEKVMFVAHDWGAMMVFDYCAKHQDICVAITMFEGFAVGWPEVPNTAEGAFYSQVAGLQGEELVIGQNFWLQLIQFGSNRDLSADQTLDYYYAPFSGPGNHFSQGPQYDPVPKASTRWPIRMLHLDIPIGVHPKHSFEWMEANYAALKDWLPLQMVVLDRYAPDTPITFPPDSVHAARFRVGFKNITEVLFGPGNHFSQEDKPTQLATTMAGFLKRFV